jgi:hypothetical protein
MSIQHSHHQTYHQHQPHTTFPNVYQTHHHPTVQMAKTRAMSKTAKTPAIQSKVASNPPSTRSHGAAGSSTNTGVFEQEEDAGQSRYTYPLPSPFFLLNLFPFHKRYIPVRHCLNAGQKPWMPVQAPVLKVQKSEYCTNSDCQDKRFHMIFLIIHGAIQGMIWCIWIIGKCEMDWIVKAALKALQQVKIMIQLLVLWVCWAVHISYTSLPSFPSPSSHIKSPYGWWHSRHLTWSLHST